MRTPPSLRLEVLAVLTLTACSASHSGPTGPALETCDYGLFHADCGGAGGPTLACDRVSGACRWFATSVVADHHEVSDCAPENVCCHEPGLGPAEDAGAGGTRAWAWDEWVLSGDALARAQTDLGILRRIARVVTPDDPIASIAVVVGEPAEPPPPEPVVTCGPAPGPAICFAPSRPRLSSGRLGDSIVLRFVQLSDGELIVELLPGDASDTWRARIFDERHIFDTPVWANCGAGSGGGAIAATGTVTLTAASFADPTNAHGVLDFESPEPGMGHVTVRF